jgi:hypothetical protein
LGVGESHAFCVKAQWYKAFGNGILATSILWRNRSTRNEAFEQV